MNENLDLVEILKDCPKGTKLYSTVFGNVEFVKVYKNKVFPIEVKRSDNTPTNFAKDGKLYVGYSGECALFPSKEQRDWSKFSAPWLKKERFDPTTLRHFDKVLVRDTNEGHWRCAFYSHKKEKCFTYKYATTGGKDYKYCIPYNKKTEHLVDTNEEVTEYYRYWED